MFSLKQLDRKLIQTVGAIISSTAALVFVWGLRGRLLRWNGVEDSEDAYQAMPRCEQLDVQRARTNRRARKRDSVPAFCGAKNAAASTPMKLDYLDRFLRWDCGLTLQQMGLFPNSKEITESMACLNAIEKHLPVRFSDVSTTCVVVGDGSTPRTAALLAMRSKWRRIVSVDPALMGLPVAVCQETEVPSTLVVNAEVPQKPKRRLNKVEQQAHQACQEAPRRERMKEKLARITELERLELAPSVIEAFSIRIESGRDEHVVVILPHAHVVPEVALRALDLDDFLLADPLEISVIQLPCCQFKKHHSIFGQLSDVQYDDACICGPAQQVRIWKNVGGFVRKSVGFESCDDAEAVSNSGRRKKRPQRKRIPGSSQSLVNFKAHLQPQYHVSPCVGKSS